MTDTYTLETELISYLSAILQAAPPDEIQRGFVPEGMDTGIALCVAGREDPGDYEMRSRLNTVIVSGKFKTRREAFQFIDALDAAFPAYGVRLGTAFCHSIEPDAGGAEPPRQETENGRLRWFASYVLHVSAY